jgi:hypothetical protein
MPVSFSTQVDPSTANLCQEVGEVLAEARRVLELELQAAEAQVEAARLSAQLFKAQQQHEQQREYWAQQHEELWAIIRAQNPLASSLSSVDETSTRTPPHTAADITLAIKPLYLPLDPWLDFSRDLLPQSMQGSSMEPDCPVTYTPNLVNLVMGSSNLTKLLSARESNSSNSGACAKTGLQEARRCASVGSELSALLQSLDEQNSTSQPARCTSSTPAISIQRIWRSPQRSGRRSSGEARTAAVQLLSSSPGMSQPCTPVADSAPLITLAPISPNGTSSSPAFRVDWQLA